LRTSVRSPTWRSFQTVPSRRARLSVVRKPSREDSRETQNKLRPPRPSGGYASLMIRVSYFQPALRRALLESRGAIHEKGAALLELFRADTEPPRRLSDIVTKDALDGFDHKQIVRLARELHDRVLDEVPGYSESLANLVFLIDELPLHTAGCFYFGLLASMYLERSTNFTRLPPRSPVAEMLFVRQGREFAARPIAELARRLTISSGATNGSPAKSRATSRPAFGPSSWTFRPTSSSWTRPGGCSSQPG